MKDPKPIICWRTSMTLPTRPGTYGDLCIDIRQLRPPGKDEYEHRIMPVPILKGRFMDKEVLNLKFQSNFAEVADGHTGGAKWYGGRMSLDFENITGESVLLPWIRKHFTPDTTHDAASVVGMLMTHGTRVAYSCTLSHFVAVRHWHDAEQYVCYLDDKIPRNGGEGCIVNVYVHHAATPEEITRAVSKALRASTYCSDSQFAAWIDNGSKYRASYVSGHNAGHRPHALSEIFGEPMIETLIADHAQPHPVAA